MKTRKQQIINDNYCTKCDKLTAKRELEENAQYGGYGFSKICNRCADHIDNQQASQQDD